MADALAKAMEIAARLSGGLGYESSLGKRNIGEVGGHTQQKKIYIPVKEHPEINYLGLLIGPRGSTQKQLQEMSGAKVHIRGKGASKAGSSNTHPDDQDELHVCIEGSEEAIAKAAKEVEGILFDPESANRLKTAQLANLKGAPDDAAIYGGGGVAQGFVSSSVQGQVELRVPNNMVGLIIGKGGENLLRIQMQLQVNVQIQKESEMMPGDTLRTIVLKGADDAVTEARRRIEEVIAAQSNKLGVGRAPSSGGGLKELDSAFLVKLPVPNDKVGIIIGKGGCTVRAIQERSKAIVQIPGQPDADDPQKRTLTIGGDTKEICDAAQLEIFNALNASKPPTQEVTGSSISVVVPDDKTGLVIGKGGVTCKDIQARLGVKLIIPQVPDPGTMPPTRTISVTGNEQAQANAKYEIEMIVAGTPMNPAGGTGMPPTQSAYGGMDMGGGMQQSAYSMYGQQQGYQANSYAMQQGMYGMDPYAQMNQHYGQGMNPYMMQQQQSMYMQQQPQAAAATSSAATETPTDPTHYYNDFWQYAAYYGEAAARLYYEAWSPPAGTPPPPGITVAPDGGVPPAAATSAATEPAAAAVPAEPSAARTSSAGQPQSESSPPLPTNGSSRGTSDNGQVEAIDATADPEGAEKAWEAYKKQYGEWYEAHGKAAGADPNPPSM